MSKMIRAHIVKRIMLIALAFTLVGCGVAKISVTKVDGSSIPKHRSIYYALPKTQISLAISQSTSTTRFVHGSTDTRPLSKLCSSILSKKNVKLTTVTSKSGFNIEATLVSVPDPDQVFAIALGAGYFEDYDLDLDLGVTGLINGAEIKAVDNTDKVVISALATAASAYTGGTSGALASLALTKSLNSNKRFSALPSDQQYDIWKKVIAAQERINVRVVCDVEEKKVAAKIQGLESLREKRLKTNDIDLLASGKLPTVLAEYEKEINRLRGLLAPSKKNSKKVYERTIDIPAASATDCVTSSSPTLLKLDGQSLHLDICSIISDDYSMYLESIAKTEKLLDGKNKNSSKTEGFRYRIPMPARLRIAKVDSLTSSCADSPCDVFYEEEVLIPQFGTTVSLPSSLGNRTAHFDTTFAPNFGMITNLGITSAGAETEEISKTVNAGITNALKKSDQKKQDTLQAQVDYLKLQKEKKELLEALEPEDVSDDSDTL